MAEDTVYGNKGDMKITIDGMDYYPKEVVLDAKDGVSFKWKQRHWNTGTAGMAGAFDVVHRLPKGLKKSDCGPWCHECNKCKGCDCSCPVIPHMTVCSYCGALDYKGFENYAHYVQKDESGGSCQTWVMTQGSWVPILYKEW